MSRGRFAIQHLLLSGLLAKCCVLVVLWYPIPSSVLAGKELSPSIILRFPPGSFPAIGNGVIKGKGDQAAAFTPRQRITFYQHNRTLIGTDKPECLDNQ